jgi:hypothetical protein
MVVPRSAKIGQNRENGGVAVVRGGVGGPTLLLETVHEIV